MLISTLSFNHSTSTVNNAINGLVLNEDAIAAYVQDGDAVPRSQCEWRVPIRWRVTGKFSGVDVFEDDMATVSYDHGTGRWTVDVDNGSPATADTGDYNGLGNCDGLTCPDLSGFVILMMVVSHFNPSGGRLGLPQNLAHLRKQCRR